MKRPDSRALVACMASLAGCTSAPLVSASPVPVAASPSGDCSHLLRMSASQAADELAKYGLPLAWRLERTDADAGAIAEVVQVPPDGTVTNVVVSEDELVVFVSPVGDPLQEFRPEALACPSP